MSSMDAILQRLAKVPEFVVHDLLNDDSVVIDFVLPTREVVNDLLLNEHDLIGQVQVIPAEIMNWGRLVARAKRIWEVTERGYRIWRDGMYLELADVETGKKKPTEAFIQATIRVMPAYREWYQRIEQAEEEYNFLTAILNGWRSKRKLVRKAVVRQHENAAPQIGV